MFRHLTLGKLLLIFSIIISSINSISQTPPLQPTAGPGGSNYLHGDIIMTDFTAAFSADGYWLFEPDSPKPDSADLIVFNHGYGVFNPGPYGKWIEHLVKKGNIVIFPKYQLNDASLPGGYTPNAVIGIQNALTEITTNFTRVQPRMEHFAIIGHSYGGVVTANLALEYATYGTPQPQCFMLCQPGTGGINGGRLTSYANMDTSYNALIIVGENDNVVGNTFGREIMDSTIIPTLHKNYITHLADNLGNPNIQATHNEPLAKNNNLGGGTVSAVITAAYVASKIDAVDYYCYWKLADALLSCTFYGTDCEYAFGDTPEQRFMGTWSNFTPILPLIIEPTNVVSVKELTTSDYHLYPNPASNMVYISNVKNITNIKCLDASGKLIKSYQNVKESIKINELSSGLYFMEITTDTETIIKKLIIE